MKKASLQACFFLSSYPIQHFLFVDLAAQLAIHNAFCFAHSSSCSAADGLRRLLQQAERSHCRRPVFVLPVVPQQLGGERVTLCGRSGEQSDGLVGVALDILSVEVQSAQLILRFALPLWLAKR